MDPIYDGATGDSEQRTDRVGTRQSNDLLAPEPDAGNGLLSTVIAEGPLADKQFTRHVETELEIHNSPAILDNVPILKESTIEYSAEQIVDVPTSLLPADQGSEHETKPVLLREIEPKNAVHDEIHSRATTMVEDEYWATEYGLHFPMTATGSGGNDGGMQPPKETAHSEPTEPAKAAP